MNDEDFMRQAIVAAKEAEAAGGLAIGAVLVKDGQVVARGLSTPWVVRDPSNHSEIDCIRSYAKQSDEMDMQGCTLYGTLEPCSMCFGAALWAGVDRVVFGAYAVDVPDNPFELTGYSVEEVAKRSLKFADPARGPVAVTGGVLRAECSALLDNYKNWMRVDQ